MLVNTAIPVAQEIDTLGASEWVITIPGVMRGKGRPRFSTRGAKPRAYTDTQTESLESWVRQCALDQVGQLHLDGPLSLQISITVPMAKSWSKAKRQAAEAGGLMPIGKPDIDNTTKLLADALNGILWADDSQICDLHAGKRYGHTPMTVLRVEKI